MKKKLLIIIGVVIILLVLIYGIMFFIDYNKVLNCELPIFVTKSDDNHYNGLGYTVEVKYYENMNTIESLNMKMFGKTVAGIIQDIYEFPENINENAVIIENSNIKNENLIDNFINNSINNIASTLQIDTISDDGTDTVMLEFVPGENTSSNIGETTTVTIPSTPEEYQNYYGYYKVTSNGEEKRFDKSRWQLKRNTQNNTVQLILSTFLIEVTDIPIICNYNLDSSAYEKYFDDLSYYARKDLGIEQIAKPNEFDNDNFGVYTFAGDVYITIEGDMVYSLEDALNQNVINVQDIINQAKQDEKYGICDIGYFSDGGSTEYLYNNYTILKYNTLDGNKDLVIGMSGTIINQLNKIGYKNV